MTQPTRLVPVADHRNFDDGAEAIPEFGPSFELGGETFHCVPAAPGAVLARLMASVRVDERGRQVYDAPNLVLFVEDVLAEEMPVEQPATVNEDGSENAPAMVVEPVDDVERWRALMKDKKRPVQIKVIGDIVLWLNGWYTDRPTQPSGR